MDWRKVKKNTTGRQISKWVELIQIKNNGNEKWRNGEKVKLRDDWEEEYHRTWQLRCGA